MTPELPYVPSWRNLRVYILGALWATLLPATPVFAIIAHDIWYNEPTNWNLVRAVAAVTVGPAIVAYRQKYKALLQPPPVAEIAVAEGAA